MGFLISCPWSSYLLSLLLSLSLFLSPSLADFPSVLPSNNSQDLAGDHSAQFNLQGPSFPSDLPLAPLTDYFANLTDKQLQVRSSPVLVPSPSSPSPLPQSPPHTLSKTIWDHCLTIYLVPIRTSHSEVVYTRSTSTILPRVRRRRRLPASRVIRRITPARCLSVRIFSTSLARNSLPSYSTAPRPLIATSRRMPKLRITTTSSPSIPPTVGSPLRKSSTVATATALPPSSQCLTQAATPAPM